MTNFLLGVIAVSVFVMAAIQVALIVGVVMAARRGGQLIGRIEADIKPIVANLQAMSSDAAKATSLAAGQVERADHLITNLTNRVEETVTSFHATILQPARDALSLLGALRAAAGAFRGAGAGERREKRAAADRGPASDAPPAEDEDNLFVG
mgnify:CR=1 FL=1